MHRLFDDKSIVPANVGDFQTIYLEPMESRVITNSTPKASHSVFEIPLEIQRSIMITSGLTLID